MNLLKQRRIKRRIKWRKGLVRKRIKRRDWVKQRYWMKTGVTTPTSSTTTTQTPQRRISRGQRIRSLKTNIHGHIIGLSQHRRGVSERHRRLPTINAYRLGQFTTEGNDIEAKKMRDAEIIMDIYRRADLSQVNIPRDANEIKTSHPRYHIFTKPRDRTIVGVGAYDTANFEIKGVFIIPEFRGRRYGSSIVKKLEGELKNSGASYAIVYVKRDNITAQNFWKSVGYAPTHEKGSTPNSIRYQKNFIFEEQRSQMERPFRVLEVV